MAKITATKLARMTQHVKIKDPKTGVVTEATVRRPVPLPPAPRTTMECNICHDPENLVYVSPGQLTYGCHKACRKARRF
jgi:hypothetical protein